MSIVPQFLLFPPGLPSIIAILHGLTYTFPFSLVMLPFLWTPNFMNYLSQSSLLCFSTNRQFPLSGILTSDLAISWVLGFLKLIYLDLFSHPCITSFTISFLALFSCSLFVGLLASFPQPYLNTVWSIIETGSQESGHYYSNLMKDTILLHSG